MSLDLSLNGANDAMQDWMSRPYQSVLFESVNKTQIRLHDQRNVTCTFYDSMIDDFKTVDAKVVNEINGDLLLALTRPLEVDMPILVRLKHFSEKDTDDEELKEGIHAQVIKCDRVFAAERVESYQIAIKYYEKS